MSLDPTPPGIGVVAPYDLALDRELWRWVPDRVSLYLTRTPNLNLPVSVEMADALNDLETIAQACRDIATPAPGAIVYLCTSGSFVGGRSGEKRIRMAMQEGGARHALTTSGALLDALEVLSATRVAVATPYDAKLTARLVDFLTEAGIQTTGTEHLGMGSDMWRVSAQSVRELARAVPAEGADAVFLSCTNLPTYEVIPSLEAELGLPVLSANLVSIWAALRELKQLPTGRPERLFATD